MVVGARVVVGLAVVVGGTVVVVGGNVVGGGGVVVVTTVVEGCASNSESPDLLHPAINTTATSSPATVLMPHVTSRPAGQPEGPPGCRQGKSGCVTPVAAWPQSQ